MRGIISRNSCMEIFAILILIITVTLKPVDAVLGFDCRSKIKNVRTISLLDIDECDIKDDAVEISYPKIALLNLNEFAYTDTIQCKVEIERIVNYCGMSSHNSIVNNGFAEYMYPVTHEMCEAAHQSGTMKVNGIEIKGLTVDKEHIEPIQLGGSVNAKGSCDGAHYSDLFGAWDNVIAQGTVKVNLRRERVKTKITSDKIVFRSGYQCKLSDGHCINPYDGYVFWDSLPRTNCSANTYSKLYKGNATQFETENESIITVNDEYTSFTLNIVGSQKSCGVTVFKTKHPKLFIVRLDDFNFLYRRNIVNSRHDDSEIFRYVDTKFMYVENFIQTQVKSLYTNFKKHNCKLEREILKNTLSIAATQPDQFAYRYMLNPGYMAVVAGEVIHIVECLPVSIRVRHSDKCYNRLPIEIGNQSLFLTPLTHIITKYATELPCDTPMREKYKFGDTWITLMPEPMIAPSPAVLQTKDKMNFTFDNPKALERWGIYQKKELEGMQGRIMFPIDQIVVQQTMAQQIAESMERSGSVEYLFDENTMQKLTENIWSRSWGRFINFGTTCAGLIGIFVLVVTIITIIDICIRGYGLHSIYGWSIHMLGAFWDPLAREMFIRGNNRVNQIKPTLPYHKLKKNKTSIEFLKCVKELKSTKPPSKPKVEKKPDIKRIPDLKTESCNNNRPCEILKPVQGSDEQVSDRLNELIVTKPANQPQVEKKPEIPRKPDLSMEISKNNRPCEILKPVQRSHVQFSNHLNELIATKSANQPQVEKKPDLKTTFSNGAHPCEVPIFSQRQNNPFLNCIRELEGRKEKN